jgi:RNA polymerase sigma factor (sigma-70 family)
MMMVVNSATSSRSAEGADASAFVARLYGEHYASLVRAAYLLLGDQSTAEEVVQEAFLDLYRRGVHQLHDRAMALPYIRGAVTNLARSRLRRLAVARRFRPSPGQGVTSAEEQVVLDEIGRSLIRGLRDLSARQRECLVLRYYLDLTDVEIARVLGLTPSSVKTHVRRGLAMLHKRLKGGL